MAQQLTVPRHGHSFLAFIVVPTAKLTRRIGRYLIWLEVRVRVHEQYVQRRLVLPGRQLRRCQQPVNQVRALKLATLHPGADRLHHALGTRLHSQTPRPMVDTIAHATATGVSSANRPSR